MSINEKKIPTTIIKEVGQNFRQVRKRRGITIKELSEKSGVSYSSIRRFEGTGQISLISLTKLAFIMDLTDQITNLFTNIAPQSMAELLKAQEKGMSWDM